MEFYKFQQKGELRWQQNQNAWCRRKTFFMNFHTLHLFIFYFSPSLWVTVYKQNIYSDTHSGSLRSNSMGEGGRLGDCQNRPEKREKNTFRDSVGF